MTFSGIGVRVLLAVIAAFFAIIIVAALAIIVAPQGIKALLGL